MHKNSKSDYVLHYYIISDTIGETAHQVAKAAIAQFPTVKTQIHQYTFVNSTEQLDEILADAHKNDGLLFTMIVNNDLANYVEKFCVQTGIICYNLVQPFLLEIQRRTNVEPVQVPGKQHELSSEYFERIKAIEFAIQYDDGQDPSGFLKAEIILLGVSRTGKTPLSMYLGTLGYKVANLPLVPEHQIPDELYQAERSRIVGLTNEVDLLNRYRENRMKDYGVPEGSRYASTSRVKEELEFAYKVFSELGCSVINVANQSIEESASIIIDVLNLPVK